MKTSNYIYSILCMRQPQLTAEEKYFLIRLLAKYGCDALIDPATVVARTVSELESDLGMTDTQIKKARDELIAKKFLVRCPIYIDPENKQGRPREGFKVVGLLELHGAHQPIVQHEKRIQNLLLWGDSELKSIKECRVAGKRKHSLTPANRITLAVLFYYADACGVVRNLGHADLAKLSGLTTQDRFESQLNKLLELGYIYSQVGGVTGKYLFGRQMGAIFLNVFSNNLLYEQGSETLILMENKVLDFYNESFWGKRPFKNLVTEEMIAKKNEEQSLLNDVSYLKDQLNAICKKNMYKNFQCKSEFLYVQHIFNNKEVWAWIEDFSIFGLSSFFKERNLMNFIQHKINQYASRLLSDSWDTVNFNKCYSDCINDIYQDIEMDFLQKASSIYKTKKELKDASSSKIKYKELESLKKHALILFIYRLVVDVAIYAKSILLNAYKNDSSLNGDDYEIVSFQYGGFEEENPDMIKKIAIIRLNKKNAKKIKIINITREADDFIITYL